MLENALNSIGVTLAVVLEVLEPFGKFGGTVAKFGLFRVQPGRFKVMSWSDVKTGHRD